MRNPLPLPVYKIEVSDADKSCYYLDSKDSSCRYFNDNTRIRAWMYKGLHCLNIPFFAQRPGLRHLIMCPFLLGGTFVSLTGLVLSIRWIKRRRRL